MNQEFLKDIRITVDGRFFRNGSGPFYVKGVTYGPFKKNSEGEDFPEPEQVLKDFRQIRVLGANLIRIYHVPSREFLDTAGESGLKVLLDVPWGKHLDFFHDKSLQVKAFESVRAAAKVCRNHPAVFALSVVNEFAPDLVRWAGYRKLGKFVDSLICTLKEVDSSLLSTFANYPPTEYLESELIDFHSFNIYLHDHEKFENYLSRLINLADGKPLLLTETGIDSIRLGKEKQAEILCDKLEVARSAGLAGAIIFSYTDEWFTGGYPVTDWAFGLTNTAREIKPAYSAVQEIYQKEFPPIPNPVPKVSVVVATKNGARTLRECLQTLSRLRYPDYEIIVVNDGSTDETAKIIESFSNVKCITHKANQGLSGSRNDGYKAASGDIVAYTDDDCRVPEYWLNYLCQGLIESQNVAVGGPNYLPVDDPPVARAVMASPGNPSAVLLNDKQAEHIPGCNMAFWKWALEETGGFDPIFRCAGDDVDFCWRILQKGWTIGWKPSAFVWHCRRSTVKAYLKQQAGYGYSERLLMQKHPERFNSFGACTWKGRIYAVENTSPGWDKKRIYHGIFGTGLFQTIYTQSRGMALLLLTTLEYHLAVTFPLLVLGVFCHQALWFALASFCISVSVCIHTAFRQKLVQPSWFSRPLVALLFFLQPIIRSWARYRAEYPFHTSLTSKGNSDGDSGEVYPNFQDKVSLHGYENSLQRLVFSNSIDFTLWSQEGMDRVAYLEKLKAFLLDKNYIVRVDTGWDGYDFQVSRSLALTVNILTFSEPHSEGARAIKVRMTPHYSRNRSLMIKSFLLTGIVLAVAEFLVNSTLILGAVLFGVFTMALCFGHFKKRVLLREMAFEIVAFSRNLKMKTLPPKK